MAGRSYGSGSPAQRGSGATLICPLYHLLMLEFVAAEKVLQKRDSLFIALAGTPEDREHALLSYTLCLSPSPGRTAASCR